VGKNRNERKRKGEERRLVASVYVMCVSSIILDKSPIYIIITISQHLMRGKKKSR